MAIFLYLSGVFIVYRTFGAFARQNVSGIAWYWILLVAMFWPLIPLITIYDWLSNDRIERN